MPLYKRKPFPLVENPKDLKPRELVFQIRFTKEIFRDYSEYLKRVNLYRKRIWTCKISGKVNLTYEEALLSEKKASDKVQQFPKELVPIVLSDIQFSMASMKDLVNSIVAKLQGPLTEGCEMSGRKNTRFYPCKIVNILEGKNETQYEIAWLDKDKKVTGNALLKGGDLIRTKLPFTREILKSFIRESTYRYSPWVIHESLAKQHGISINPPNELKSKYSLENGLVISNRKRKKTEDKELKGKSVMIKCNASTSETLVENKEITTRMIKYPIEDLLLKPYEYDEGLIDRPVPCKDFNIPMDCVGDLLMVWEFCASFGRLLHLSPFTLEDFENALCNKESNLVLIAETHSSLLRMLIKDKGEYFMTIQKKKRKPKISFVTWTEYLCDYLEMCNSAEVSTHVLLIKRGDYGDLDIHVKLKILRDLIAKALETVVLRDKLDECIDERYALAAIKREQAIEEGRKKRDEKKLKTEPIDNNNKVGPPEGCNNAESDVSNTVGPGPNPGDVSKKSKQKRPLDHSESDQGENAPKENTKKQKTDVDVTAENSIKRAVHKMMKNEIKDLMENKTIEQRKEFLEREIEKRYIRPNPLGKDKDYNRYWFFRRGGRIFVESSDSLQWGYYYTKEEIDALLGSLNSKGIRESALKKQLEKCYDKICSEMQKRAKNEAQRIAMEEAVHRRSTRIRAPPRENPADAFLKYVNKWKED